MKRKKEGRERGNPTGFVNPNVLKGTRTPRGRTTYPMEPHRVPPLPDLGTLCDTHLGTRCDTHGLSDLHDFNAMFLK